MKNLHLILLNWIVNLANTDQIDFAVGGQAVIEGVMMRSPNAITIAVRKPNKKISVKKDHYKILIQRYPKLNIPIVRGVINLFEMMIIGTKAINYSANESLEEALRDEEIKKESKWEKALEVTMFIISFILALALSLTLFKALPLWITTFLEGHVTAINENFLLFNFTDGVLKALIFLSYIFLLSLIPSFRRVFEYHGAEHKAIFNYEEKIPLTVENSKKQSRFHPRCGTSFIIIVFLLSIVIYTFVPKQETFLMNLGLRILVLPIVAGISYEALKISAKNTENALVKIFIAPGLAFQRLTTKEPYDDQLEVSLKSLETALEMEKTA